VTSRELAKRGKKVALREKRLGDAAQDYRWRTDPELAKLDAAAPLRMTYEEYQRMYEHELHHASPWVRRFAIETHDGVQIGNCMYYDADFVKGQTELGILIGEPDYWGKGYGTEAVDLLLEHIFLETPLRRVYLHTLEWNLRAQRSFAKSGFVPVRPVRRNGHAFLLMEITQERWATQREEGLRRQGRPQEKR
jgi:RimJ/RimL family protein N-acetyltransferase